MQAPYTYALLKKNAVFKFGELELQVVESLKEKLVSELVLAIYSPNAETELHYDASSIAFGSILLQRQPDSKFYPVFYFSKRTTEQESKYHSLELKTSDFMFICKD